MSSEQKSISWKGVPSTFQPSPTGEMLLVWYLFVACDLLQKN